MFYIDVLDTLLCVFKFFMPKCVPNWFDTFLHKILFPFGFLQNVLITEVTPIWVSSKIDVPCKSPAPQAINDVPLLNKMAGMFKKLR